MCQTRSHSQNAIELKMSKRLRHTELSSKEKYIKTQPKQLFLTERNNFVYSAKREKRETVFVCFEVQHRQLSSTVSTFSLRAHQTVFISFWLRQPWRPNVLFIITFNLLMFLSSLKSCSTISKPNRFLVKQISSLHSQFSRLRPPFDDQRSPHTTFSCLSHFLLKSLANGCSRQLNTIEFSIQPSRRESERSRSKLAIAKSSSVSRFPLPRAASIVCVCVWRWMNRPNKIITEVKPKYVNYTKTFSSSRSTALREKVKCSYLRLYRFARRFCVQRSTATAACKLRVLENTRPGVLKSHRLVFGCS